MDRIVLLEYVESADDVHTFSSPTSIVDNRRVACEVELSLTAVIAWDR